MCLCVAARDIQEPFVQSRHQQNQANQQQQQLQQQFNVQRSIPSQQAPQQPRQLSRPAPASQLPLSMTQQLLQYPQQQQSNFSAAPLYASRAAAHPAQSAAALPQLHTNTQPSVNNIERLELERRDMRQRQEEIQQLEVCLGFRVPSCRTSWKMTETFSSLLFFFFFLVLHRIWHRTLFVITPF